MATPGKSPIVMYSGASHDILFAFKDSGGADFDISAYDTFTLNFYKLNSLAVEESYALTRTGSELTKTLTVAEVQALPKNGRYELLFSDGTDVDPVLRDSLTVTDVRGDDSISTSASVTLSSDNVVITVTDVELNRGWSPILAVVNDGDRRVWQYADWVGGTGSKPDTGQYVGATGFVDLIADAIDIRGERGERGEKGEQGEGIGTHETTVGNHTDVDLTTAINSLELDDEILIKNQGVYKPISYNNFLNQINLDNWFTMVIKTDNAGTSTNTQFTIPTFGSGYNFTVLWGDGKSDTGVTGNITHTYDIAGTYTVRIRGDFPTIRFNNGGDKDKLLEIKSWGDIKWSNFQVSFRGCSNLVSANSININTSNVTNFEAAFQDCSSLTSINVSGFDTSNATRMDFMFSNCTSLTSLNLSGFVTSNATRMDFMFNGCTSLTSLDLSGFDTSNVTNFSRFLSFCTSLTSVNISSIDTSSATLLHGMFRESSLLTSLDLSGFVTSNVTDMFAMFNACTSLTSLDVSGFVTSNVTNMGYMFTNCTSLTNFNPSGFTITNVTNLEAFANGTNMGTTNYDNLLVNWEAQLVNNNLSPNFGNAQYTAGSPAETARQALITDHFWTITDAGAI